MWENILELYIGKKLKASISKFNNWITAVRTKQNKTKQKHNWMKAGQRTKKNPESSSLNIFKGPTNNEKKPV